MKKRYTIQHVPTKKFVYVDEGGIWLTTEEDGVFSFCNKEKADNELSELIYSNDQEDSGILCTEDGDFPIDEFQVVEI
jgi:hypothetical protein